MFWTVGVSHTLVANLQIIMSERVLEIVSPLSSDWNASNLIVSHRLNCWSIDNSLLRHLGASSSSILLPTDSSWEFFVVLVKLSKPVKRSGMAFSPLSSKTSKLAIIPRWCNIAMGAWNSVSAIKPQAMILFLHLTQFVEYFEQSPLMRKKNSSCDYNLISDCWRISSVDSKNECFENLLTQRLVNKFNGIVVVPTSVSVIHSTKLFVVAGCNKSWSNMEPVVFLSWSIGKKSDK